MYALVVVQPAWLEDLNVYEMAHARAFYSIRDMAAAWDVLWECL